MSIAELEAKRKELEDELLKINERIRYEKVFEIIARDVKPYYDEAEKEMRICNLKIACENILKSEAVK